MEDDFSESEIEITEVKYGNRTCAKKERASTAMDNAYDSISEESHSGSEDQETVPEAEGNPFKK